MTTSNKGSAFILMPFNEELNYVYEEFIKPVLEKAGFSVERADDIQSQENILRVVLEGIKNSDLIVADLTDSNPNVFYELGIAHTFGKPVILVTQSIGDVPFDLKSYRLLEYSTHFVKIKKAKEQLTKYAEGFLQKSIRFGSPVSDFSQGQGGAQPNLTADTVRNGIPDTANNDQDDDQGGFLDHLIAVNSGYNEISVIITGVTVDLTTLTKSLETGSKDFQLINANSSSSSPQAALNVARRLAGRIGHFNDRLNKANTDYAIIAENTENSLEYVAAFQKEQSEGTSSKVDEQISLLRGLRDATIEGRNGFIGLANNFDQLPRLERRLNREVTRGSEETRVMVGNLDKTIASISRALQKLE